MPSLDPQDYTAEEAQAEFYPELKPADIALYYISYLSYGSTEPDIDYRWFPIATADADIGDEFQARGDTILDYGLENEE